MDPEEEESMWICWHAKEEEPSEEEARCAEQPAAIEKDGDTLYEERCQYIGGRFPEGQFVPDEVLEEQAPILEGEFFEEDQEQTMSTFKEGDFPPEEVMSTEKQDDADCQLQKTHRKREKQTIHACLSVRLVTRKLRAFRLSLRKYVSANMF